MSEDTFRTCTKCGDEFLDDPKNWKRIAKTKMTGTCRLCDREYFKECYHKDKKKYSIKNREYRDKCRELKGE